MARVKGQNKSQAVREYLTEKPESTVKEVVAAMAAKKIEVSENLVYGIKGEFKEKSKRRKKIAKAAIAAVTRSGSGGSVVENGIVAKTDAITLIRDVKALAAKAGGYEKLKELVDALNS